MPIYAYKCESCGHAKDVLQKMSDAPLTDCPACGAPVFKKQLTAAGFQLKGSGWYATDFKGGGNAAAPVGDKSEAGSGATVTSDAGESKTGESKTGESRTGESKGRESKSDANTGSKSDPKSDPKSAPKSDVKAAAPATSKPSDSASGKAPAA